MKGSPSGLTKNEWFELNRYWEGVFNFTGGFFFKKRKKNILLKNYYDVLKHIRIIGDIGAPFKLRVTSIFDEVIEFPDEITEADLQPVKIIDSKQQFKNNFASGAAKCEYPGPSADMYTDGYQGVSFLKWRFWGGDAEQEVSSGCHRGTKCLKVVQQPYIPFQIGFQTLFSKALVAGVKFWAKNTAGGKTLQISLKGTSTSGKKTLTLTNEWAEYTVMMADLGTVPDMINVVMFQGGRDGGTFFYDDVALIPAAGKWYSPPSVNDGIKLFYDANGERASDSTPAPPTSSSSPASPQTSSATKQTPFMPTTTLSSNAMTPGVTSSLCGNGKLDAGEDCEPDDGACCDKQTCKFARMMKRRKDEKEEEEKGRCSGY